MVENFSNEDWEFLVNNIRDGLCTPFLGAGISLPRIPLGGEIARQWALSLNYPLTDSASLTRVAQYLAVDYGSVYAKRELVKKWIDSAKPLDFNNPTEIEEAYSVLAALNLPIYITTNYDSMMSQALQHNNLKNVTSLPCPWNDTVRKQLKDQSINVENIKPSDKNPVVFHLHGLSDHPASMVLTEDDYIDYVIELSKARRITHMSSDSSNGGAGSNIVLPTWIEEALSGTSLLFIGYSFSDWNFNLLFRSINYYLRTSVQEVHVSLQLTPGHGKEDWSEQQKERAKKYLDKYFGRDRIHVCFGTAHEFLNTLNGYFN